MTTVRHIHVSCAIIEKDGLVLAAQRSEAMSLPLKWEFPGGKIEPGETSKECLHRELREEMSISVDIERQLPEIRHLYNEFAITLHPFICRMNTGVITLHEHKAITWIAPEEMQALDWAEADLPLIAIYLSERCEAKITRSDRTQSTEEKIESEK